MEMNMDTKALIEIAEYLKWLTSFGNWISGCKTAMSR